MASVPKKYRGSIAITGSGVSTVSYTPGANLICLVATPSEEVVTLAIGVEVAEDTFKAAKVSDGFTFVAKQDPADPA